MPVRQAPHIVGDALHLHDEVGGGGDAHAELLTPVQARLTGFHGWALCWVVIGMRR